MTIVKVNTSQFAQDVIRWSQHILGVICTVFFQLRNPFYNTGGRHCFPQPLLKCVLRTLCEAERPLHCYTVLLVRLFFFFIKQNDPPHKFWQLVLPLSIFYLWQTSQYLKIYDGFPSFPTLKNGLPSTLNLPKFYSGYLEDLLRSSLKLVPLIWRFSLYPSSIRETDLDTT